MGPLLFSVVGMRFTQYAHIFNMGNLKELKTLPWPREGSIKSVTVAASRRHVWNPSTNSYLFRDYPMPQEPRALAYHMALERQPLWVYVGFHKRGRAVVVSHATGKTKAAFYDALKENGFDQFGWRIQPATPGAPPEESQSRGTGPERLFGTVMLKIDATQLRTMDYEKLVKGFSSVIATGLVQLLVTTASLSLPQAVRDVQKAQARRDPERKLKFPGDEWLRVPQVLLETTTEPKPVPNSGPGMEKEGRPRHGLKIPRDEKANKSKESEKPEGSHEK